MKVSLPPAAVLALTLLAQCRADAPAPDPVSLLPPATQNGTRAFGCLVNGQAYLPEGRVGLGSNYYVMYDPTYNGGDLIIGTYRAGKTEYESLAIGGHHISRTGTYSFGPTTTLRTFYRNDQHSAPCDNCNNQNAGTFSKGTLTVTRLDLQAGIIAGAFDFVLAKPGCDTLRATQGRFDYKF